MSVAVSTAMIAAACGARTIDGARAGGTDANGTAGNSSGTTGGGGGATGGSSGAGGRVPGDAACEATCTTSPARQPFRFSTAAHAYQVMAGAWQFCAGGREIFMDSPADAIGVEFGPVPPGGLDYELFYLVQGPSGPVRGTGNGYKRKYLIFLSTMTGIYMINVDPYVPSPYMSFTRTLDYSPCPSIALIGTPVGQTARLVRFP